MNKMRWPLVYIKKKANKTDKSGISRKDKFMKERKTEWQNIFVGHVQIIIA